MPTDYNPDEFARAKHLVALAEQINTKINTVSARTSRPVSLAYKKSDNTYAQLDSAASALSIPFENLTAVLRIASGDEDIVPTITLSNNVTASTPTYSNGAFETTLTLPSASVTSFSMTIALPQTETFSAWQKTFTVTNKPQRTLSRLSVGNVACQDLTTNPLLFSVPATDLDANNRMYIRFTLNNIADYLDQIAVFTTNAEGTRCYSVNINLNSATWPWSYQLLIVFPDNSARTYITHLYVPENDDYAAFNRDITITITQT